jgi:hypothetical protein
LIVDKVFESQAEPLELKLIYTIKQPLGIAAVYEYVSEGSAATESTTEKLNGEYSRRDDGCLPQKREPQSCSI